MVIAVQIFSMHEAGVYGSKSLLRRNSMGADGAGVGGICVRALIFILAGGKQDEGAGLDDFDAAFLGHACEFGIFGAGVHYQALGFEADDVVVIFGLALWPDVQCDGVDAFDTGHAFEYGEAADLAFFDADAYGFVAVFDEFHHCFV